MLRTIVAVACVILTTLPALSAEKVDLPSQIAAAKMSVENIAASVGNYPKALTEIEKARQSLKKAEQVYDKGQKWMGLGGLKPEAEQEVSHNLQMVDMAISLAKSKAAKGRTDEEAAALDKQLAVVKARVKLLEDIKADDDRLRQTAQKYDAASKELANLKADQGKLVSQLDQVTADKKKLEGKVAALTEEKAELATQLEAAKKIAQPATVPQPLPSTPK
jgi:chromosome segregation ATPase